jgi:hypothetical protein
MLNFGDRKLSALTVGTSRFTVKKIKAYCKRKFKVHSCNVEEPDGPRSGALDA